MIDYRFVLMVVFTIMLFAIVFNKEETIATALLYVSGFGFFIIGLDFIIRGVPDVSIFLSSALGIVLWGLGIILLIRTPLLQIEKEW